MLRKGQLDAIIVALPFTEPDIEVRELYTEPFEVLLPATHPWSEPSILPNNCILKMYCYSAKDIASVNRSLMPALRSKSVYDRDNVVAEGSSLETLRHMVASGLGVTVLPASAAGLRKLRTWLSDDKALHKARTITNCSRGMEEAVPKNGGHRTID